jgi:hypothetical protein
MLLFGLASVAIVYSATLTNAFAFSFFGHGESRRLDNDAFDITVIFTTAVPDAVNVSMQDATDKWSTIFNGDVGGPVTLKKGKKVCGIKLQQDVTVPDLLIFASIAKIDGKPVHVWRELIRELTIKHRTRQSSCTSGSVRCW